MDRIGGFTVGLAAFLLAALIPWPVRAQSSDPRPRAIPPPPIGERLPGCGAEPCVPRNGRRLLWFSGVSDTGRTYSTAAREPTDRRLPVDFAAHDLLPGQSPLPSPVALRAAQPPSRSLTPAGESTAPISAVSPPPGEPFARLERAPLEPTDFGFPINLATALRLSDARPLIVAAAQASVWVAEAQLTRAKVIWIPTMVLGADYIRHDGGGPDFNKGIMTAPSVNYFYAGGGMDLSSLTAFVNLTDVFFEPLVARQVLNSRQWDIQAAKNDALLLTADAYFRVHQYRGMYTGALYCVERGRELVEQIASLSNELVTRVEVERARNLLADLEQQATSARQAWRVSSANLTQVLRLNPRAVVVPLEHDHLQLTLIDPARRSPTCRRSP